ncbi:MFS transporter [Microbacterium halophytorum]|uniref:MFS transporter n=1 Tax=Microbacterium halophytorum TaxID=2067568 RepID=UPI000CFC9120|nr:MFS transporter [Microbacterium halophytorum]
MSTASSARTATPKKSSLGIFLLCWLAIVGDGYDLAVYGATLPGFLGPENWGVTPTQAGVVGSIALVGMLVGSLVAGTLSDRIGRRRMLAIAVVTFSVFMLACAAAPDFTWFAAFRLLACLGIGGLLPVAVSVANEFASPERKSIAVGLVLTAPAVGLLLAATISMNVLPQFGVRPVYAIGGLALLLVPFLLRSIPESPTFLRSQGREDEAARIAAQYGLPEEAQTTRAIRASGDGGARGSALGGLAGLFRDGMASATVLIWVACVISLLTIFGLTTWLPQIMRESGFGTSASISFLIWYSVGAIGGTVIGSVVSQRTSPKFVMTVGFVAAAVALGSLLIGVSGPVLIVAVVLAGFGGMGTQNMLNDHVAQYYPGHVRATGLGWALGVGRVGAIAGPYYGSLVIGTDGAIGAAALAFGVPAAIGVVVALLMPRRRKAPTV